MSGTRNAWQTKWAKYDACPDCGTLPRNPCRTHKDSHMMGARKIRLDAHPNRPLLAEVNR